MSGVWDMNEDRSGDKLFLGINKTIYLMDEDRISMAELVALWSTFVAVCVQGQWFELMWFLVVVLTEKAWQLKHEKGW